MEERVLFIHYVLGIDQKNNGIDLLPVFPEMVHWKNDYILFTIYGE